MFAKSVVAIALLFAGLVAAAAESTTDNSNYTINPDSVSLSTRSSWCIGEITSCGYLCSGLTNNNTCDPDTLTYSCLCASNDSQPGLQYYASTLPSYICEVIFQDCIANNTGDLAAQTECTKAKDENCGTLNAENYTATATSTSTTTTSASKTASSTASATSSKAAAATLKVGREFGTGVVAAGIMAAFGFML